MDNKPLISVVMASYNYECFLEESIASIFQQVSSEWELELVVVDDASTDHSQKKLREIKKNSPIPLKFFFHEHNQGASVTIKEAVEHATGKYIAFTAADDVFLPNRFSDQFSMMESDERIGVVFANGRIMTESGRGERVHGDAVERLLKQDVRFVRDYLYTHSSPLFLQTVLVRKGVLERSHAMSGECLADDWLTNIRLFEYLSERHMKAAYVDRDVFLYRVHANNLHKDLARQEQLKLEMISEIIPRSFRRRAKANIFWELGMSYGGRKKYGRGIGFLLRSFITRPSWENISSLAKKVFC